MASIMATVPAGRPNLCPDRSQEGAARQVGRERRRRRRRGTPRPWSAQTPSPASTHGRDRPLLRGRDESTRPRPRTPARARARRSSLALVVVEGGQQPQLDRRRRRRRSRARAATSSVWPISSRAPMSAPCAAPRTWRSTSAVNGMSSAPPSRKPSGARTSRGTPLARTATGAGRARAGRRRASPAGRARTRMIRPRAPSRVLVRARAAARVPTPADCRSGPHDQQREAPDALAPERQRAAREPVLVLGHPRAVGVGAHEMAVADARPSPGRARLRGSSSARRRGPRTSRMVSSSAASTSSSRHRADHRHAAKTRSDAMSSFSLDGQRLAYTVHGEGPRLTVLLHGLLFNQRMHEALARALAARGHRVVTLDLLGHGDSDRPRDKWRYSMPAFGAPGGRAARPPRASPRRSCWARRWARTWRWRRRRRRRSACAGW